MLQTFTATSKERGYKTKKKSQRKMTHANDNDRVLTEFAFARREIAHILT